MKNETSFWVHVSHVGGLLVCLAIVGYAVWMGVSTVRHFLYVHYQRVISGEILDRIHYISPLLGDMVYFPANEFLVDDFGESSSTVLQERIKEHNDKLRAIRHGYGYIF